jgi:hypothetical protein
MKRPETDTYIRVRVDDTMDRFTIPTFFSPLDVALRLTHSMLFVVRDGKAHFISQHDGELYECGYIPSTAREAYAEIRNIEQAVALKRAEMARIA